MSRTPREPQICLAHAGRGMIKACTLGMKLLGSSQNSACHSASAGPPCFLSLTGARHTHAFPRLERVSPPYNIDPGSKISSEVKPDQSPNRHHLSHLNTAQMDLPRADLGGASASAPGGSFLSTHACSHETKETSCESHHSQHTKPGQATEDRRGDSGSRVKRTESPQESLAHNHFETQRGNCWISPGCASGSRTSSSAAVGLALQGPASALRTVLVR